MSPTVNTRSPIEVAYDQVLKDLYTAEQSGDTRSMARLGQQVMAMQAAHPSLVDRVEAFQGMFDNTQGNLFLGNGIRTQVSNTSVGPVEQKATQNLGLAMLDLHSAVVGNA